jgi:acyl-coenzyme A synthetase/AMP-(fatty) acid ligase
MRKIINEVEQVFLSHASVLMARVELVKDDHGSHRLNAAVTLKRGHPPADELKSELAWLVAGDIPGAPPFRDITLARAPRAGGAPAAGPESPAGELVHISGHAIDTARVREVLEGLPEVASAKISAVDDPRRGSLLVAEVELDNGFESSEDLKNDMAWAVNVNIGPMALFKEIRFGGEAGADTTVMAGAEGMFVVDGVKGGKEGLDITSHRISTTEVTKALLDHPQVLDAAALTVPDKKHGETLKAFVKLRDGVVPTNDLKLDLAWHVMAHLRPIAIFKNIELEGPESTTDMVPAPDEAEEDAIRISGKTILSADTEKALADHPSVAEAAVIGIPDEVHGEALQAFVVLAEGVMPTDELKEELAWHTRTEIGPDVVFKFLEFRRFLPKADSPKHLRSILRADVMDVPTRMYINVVD